MSVDTPVIIKVCPSPSELTTIQNNLTCTEDGCAQIFTSQSNLSMHLRKHHKKENLEKSECIKQFYCPEITCAYNNIMHFTKCKYLKQHYLKVHAEKHFKCSKCDKGFSTEAVLKKHSETCGIVFICSDCKFTYASYEALTTHARRKNHKILKKSAFTTIETSNSETQLKKTSLILPKQNSSIQTLNFLPVILHVQNNCSRSDKEVQTDQKLKVKRKSTQQTQTCNRRKVRKSTETQTIGDCILKRSIQEVKLDTEAQTRGETLDNAAQTASNDLSLKFLSQNDLSISNFLHNSSSQTSLNHLDIFDDSCTFGNCNSQTQTDVIYQDEFLQSNVFTSHIETQTCDVPDMDLCSNMYTQTCDEALLSDLEFTNIQTQTNWPDYDMFVSTETQTLLTHNTKNVLDMALNGREISHMETQTDNEFKQLLEEINA